MKDPAFLFYSSDFLSGITDLTMEERGQFITLLCIQHQKGFLTEKTIRLSVGSVSVDVISKFTKDEEGNYYNERLREEAEKRSKFTESRRGNGLKGGRPKKNTSRINNLKDNHMVKHMEDVNENRNVSIVLNKKDKIEIPECSEQMRKAIDEFMEHRKSKKAPIKTQMQFDKWLKQLAKFSKGTERLSIQIIDNSIANGWTGIFELDETKQSNGKKSLDDCDRELLEGIGMNEHKLID